MRNSSKVALLALVVVVAAGTSTSLLIKAHPAKAATSSIGIDSVHLTLSNDNDLSGYANIGDTIHIAATLDNSDDTTDCVVGGTTVTADLTKYGGSSTQPLTNTDCSTPGLNERWETDFVIVDAGGSGIQVGTNDTNSEVAVHVTDTDDTSEFTGVSNPLGDGTIDTATTGGVDTIQPTIVSVSYLDQNTNGTVDTVDVNFSEDLSAGCGGFGSLDWHFTNPGSIGLSDPTAGTYSGTHLYLTVAATAHVTGGVTDPVLSYTSHNNVCAPSLNFVLTRSGIDVVDRAAPAIISAVTDDTNGDGYVDAEHVTFSEDLAATPHADNFTFAGFAGVATAITASSASTYDLTMTQTGAEPDTATVPNVTVGSGTSPHVADALTNTNTSQLFSTTTDGAKPVLLAVEKNNGSGLNELKFTYSEAMYFDSDGASSLERGDLFPAGTVTGMGTFATTGNTFTPDELNTIGGSGTANLTVDLAGQPGGYIYSSSTVEPSGVVTPLANAAVTDLAGNEVNTSPAIDPTATSASTWDLTQPTVDSITVSDAVGNNGKIDRATLVFSEDVRDNSFTDADAALGTTGSPTGTFSTGTPNDNTLIFNRTTDNNAVDTTTAAGDFTYSGATTSITDTAGNLLEFPIGGSIASSDVVETDGANPIVVSTSPVASATAGRADDIIVTFSEPMNTGTVTTSHFTLHQNGTPATGVGIAFNGPGTIGTISHDTFAQSAAIALSLTSTALFDPAGNALCGSVPDCSAAYVLDYTAHSASGGGGGGGGGFVAAPSSAATMVLNAPKNGDVLAGGSTESISWTSSGVGANNVRLYGSFDGGVTWSTLVTGLAPTGTYTWTVPNTATNLAEIKSSSYDSGAALLASATSGNFQITVNTSIPVVTPPPATSGELLSRADANAQLPSSAPVDSLVKNASASSVYYIGLDAKRHPFPTEGVYMSWYANFDAVKTVSDADLASIPMGTPVLYRPGTVLVKIVSDKSVYAVSPGYVLHWIGSEDIAKELYGANWANRVVDVDPVYFEHYTKGSDITTAEYPDGSLMKTSTSDTYYYIDSGVKRPFASTDAYLANFFQTRSAITDDTHSWTSDTLGSSVNGAEDSLYSDQLVTP